MNFELPSGFEEAVKERRLLPFIGAGFSKNVNRKFPNWTDVISRAATLLEYDSEILMAQGDYLQIAEYLDVKGLLGELYNSLSKEMDDEKKYDITISKPHLLLPYLDVPFIFTTNWDSWIERGFENQKVPYSKIITHENFVSPRKYRLRPDEDTSSSLYSRDKVSTIRQKFSETTIVKYHGDFSNHDSIVFKEGHYYDRLDFEHPLDIKLRSEIIGRSVLFIGYSFSDPNVRRVWHKLNKVMKEIDSRDHIRSFFVTHLNNPLLIEVFKKKDIETILLSPKDIKGNLEELFQYIIELQSK
jgi:hypothetical protein